MKTLKQRRKQNKTDYGKRIKLLKSGTPRIVFRKTNNYILVQYVTSKQAQDKIEFGLNSGELLKFGWPEDFKRSLKSIPATYLTGFLTGKKIIAKKLKTPIVDFGMIRTLHKTKTHAFLKGLIDAGIEMKHKEETFPDQDTIKGKHLKKDFSKIFEEIKSKIENKNG